MSSRSRTRTWRATGTIFAAAVLIPAAPATAQPTALASAAPAADTVTVTFDCTEDTQTWTVPAEITEATFTVEGAAGGGNDNDGGVGGLGGRTEATLDTTPGDTYTIEVGCHGAPTGQGTGGYGYGNGGDGGDFDGAGGGGGSAVLAAGEPILVAGGGGGAGSGSVSSDGGAGGGEVGGDAPGAAGMAGGHGGTQTEPGAGEFGGQDGSGPDGGNGAADESDGGGGGGGWRGGGGGGGLIDTASGGGGGSGHLADGIDGTMESGVNDGDGLVTITYQRATADVTVTATPEHALPGEPVDLTATVAPVAPATTTPTGGVEFFADGDSLGTTNVNASGQATITVDSLSKGSHEITADYAGNDSYAPDSSAPASVEVGKFDATVALTADPAEPRAGDEVTLTADVQGVDAGDREPTGTVEFFDGDTSLGTADIASPATLTVDGLSTGRHRITASYSGDTAFRTATSEALVVTVTADDTTPPADDPEQDPDDGGPEQDPDDGGPEQGPDDDTTDGSDDELADTGAPAIGPFVTLGLAALGTGAALTIAAIRRRRTTA